jgi:quercetin dioxygenase-like cupin family protein
MSVSLATHVRWDDLPKERLNEKLERRYVTGKHATVAQFFLTRGCIVARHSHPSEQVTHVLRGRLRLVLGADGSESVDLVAGEVLLIPSDLPHSAEALEDCIVVDFFSPIRTDWLEKRDDYFRR